MDLHSPQEAFSKLVPKPAKVFGRIATRTRVGLDLDPDDELKAVENALDLVESVKGAQTPDPVLTVCTDCTHLCDYAGRSGSDLPRFLAG